ncbi:MAG: response regulator [Candidatus Omnitrophota bacterium]
MKKAKILTIDDEPDFVALLKNYFSIRGHEVFTALRGGDGIEIAGRERPDVILVDLKLPGLDGDQILREVKKVHPGAKTIMITAFKDDGGAKQKALAAGVYAYFEKPIASFKTLEETVNKAAEEGK